MSEQMRLSLMRHAYKQMGLYPENKRWRAMLFGLMHNASFNDLHRLMKDCE